MAGEWEIREVDADRAEAVLTLRVFVPGVAGGWEDQYHLARVPPPEFIVTSVRVNRDGSVTETGVLAEAESVTCVHEVRAHGRTPDGRGCGFSQMVSIEGRSADTVAVRIEMDWHNYPAGSGGFPDQELLVPWLGAARLDLPGGGWLAAEITPTGR